MRFSFAAVTTLVAAVAFASAAVIPVPLPRAYAERAADVEARYVHEEFVERAEHAAPRALPEIQLRARRVHARQFPRKHKHNKPTSTHC
ncbi:hypothetical protein BDZ97DRAFT_1931638 [Flammula alnicola]|nr:hypothetical protein BDZ97DRAFT_1931638 [Flammula alnicola]